MHIVLEIGSALQSTITSKMFGANNIFLYNTVSGSGGTFDEAVEVLNVASIRYPGGTVTERYFDINTPDTVPIGFPSEKNFLGLTEFLDFAIQTGRSVDIVLPTSKFYSGSLSQTTNIPRPINANYTEDTLKYVERLISQNDSGEGGLPDATISSIEIGNEYWGIGLSEREYGAIVNALASRLQELFDRVLGPNAAQPEILVQMADPWGAHYTSADGLYNYLSWNQRVLLSNQQIINSIVDPLSRSAIDGLVEHFYSRFSGDAIESTGASFTNFIGIDYAIWSSYGFSNLDLHITEWNVNHNNTQQFGLKGASIFIAQMEAMIRLGVDAAFAWPVQSATTDLAGGIGKKPNLTPIGAAFMLMEESIVGKKLVQSNISSNHLEVDVYASTQEVVFFISSRSNTPNNFEIDISKSLRSFSDVFGVIISIEDGRSVVDESATAVIRNLESNDIMEYGIVSVYLKPFEIVRITFKDGKIYDAQNNNFTVGATDDFVFGNDVSNIISSLDGNDYIDGKEKSDILYGGNGHDTIFGAVDNDKIFGGDNNDHLYGGTGSDIIHGGRSLDRLSGGAGSDHLYGGAGNDILWGAAGDDLLYGGDGDDAITGGTFKDYFFGGMGADVFKFNAISNMTSTAGTTDIIFDFEQGQDKIDLTTIDASVNLSGNNIFKFGTTKSHSSTELGDLYFKKFDNPGTANDYTLVFLDNDEDNLSEGVLKVMRLHEFSASDFIL